MVNERGAPGEPEHGSSTHRPLGDCGANTDHTLQEIDNSVAPHQHPGSLRHLSLSVEMRPLLAWQEHVAAEIEDGQAAS